MTQPALDLYRERGPRALWERCLGFLDLSLEQTMALQYRLLEEHLALVADSDLGHQLLQGEHPRTVDELRRLVPLTTYDDYQSVLGARRDDMLHAPAHVWVRTSGRSSEDSFKWCPVSPGAFEEWNWLALGLLILASARGRGDVRIPPDARLLNLTAPPPYASGTLMRTVQQLWPVRQFPPQEPWADLLPFEARTGMAFGAAAEQGVDYVICLASVLAAAGERFGEAKPSQSLRERLSRPRALARMGSAALRARLAARPLRPRDAWPLRGVLTAGMDASLFRERIREAWGSYPLEFFAMTEGLVIGTQAWDFRAMTPVSTLNFLEFIPDNEHGQEANSISQPRTVLLDELEAGRNYELVITNLRGGALLRYRTGDIVRVTAMQSDATGIQLPQIASYARHSDVIDIGGFTRLTEKTVWLALELAGVPYIEWTVRKEIDGDEPVLRLRIEPPPGQAVNEQAVVDAERRIAAALRTVDSDWADLQQMAGLSPLRVTFLPPGSFDRYTERKRAEGADLGHLKPVHMNPSDRMIETLLEVSAGEQRR